MIRVEDIDGMDFSDIAPGPTAPPVTPGEILLEEFMRPLGLTSRALAAELGIPANRISSIVNGARGITAETAILLSRRFGPSPEFWMSLQSSYELARARAEMAN
jgi:addiction module HigA family antidote